MAIIWVDNVLGTLVGTGTAADPVSTISGAPALASKGDTIRIVDTGTLYTNTTSRNKISTLATNFSGQNFGADLGLRIQGFSREGFPGAKPTVDIGEVSPNWIFLSTGRGGIHVDNIRFIQSGTLTGANNVVCLLSQGSTSIGADPVKFTRCELSGLRGAGPPINLLNMDSGEITISGCYMHDSGDILPNPLVAPLMQFAGGKAHRLQVFDNVFVKFPRMFFSNIGVLGSVVSEWKFQHNSFISGIATGFTVVDNAGAAGTQGGDVFSCVDNLFDHIRLQNNQSVIRSNFLSGTWATVSGHHNCFDRITFGSSNSDVYVDDIVSASHPGDVHVSPQYKGEPSREPFYYWGTGNVFIPLDYRPTKTSVRFGASD